MIDERTIAELLNRHAGDAAWIFGKGPSLDCFDFATAGPLRICINESLLVVPEPTYFFAHDELPIQRVAARWPPSCQAILQPLRAVQAQRLGIPVNSIYTYEKRERDWNVLDRSPEKIAECHELIGMSGTVHSAIHFCRLIGAAPIVFVGMDGGGGYAARIGLDAPPGGGQHDVIRRDSTHVADRLGIPYKFSALPVIERS